MSLNNERLAEIEQWIASPANTAPPTYAQCGSSVHQPASMPIVPAQPPSTRSRIRVPDQRLNSQWVTAQLGASIPALHESAHAVAGTLLGLKTVQVAIQGEEGYTIHAYTPDDPSETRRRAVVFAAAPVFMAERLKLGLDGCQDDLDHAQVLEMEYSRLRNGLDEICAIAGARKLVAMPAFTMGVSRVAPLLDMRGQLTGDEVRELLADLGTVTL